MNVDCGLNNRHIKTVVNKTEVKARTSSTLHSSKQNSKQNKGAKAFNLTLE